MKKSRIKSKKHNKEPVVRTIDINMSADSHALFNLLINKAQYAVTNVAMPTRDANSSASLFIVIQRIEMDTGCMSI